MGWNDGYTIMEQTVVGAYDLGKLDKDLLGVLLEPYRDTDIDSGGRTGLQSGDGKDIEQIVIETFGLAMPDKPSVQAPDYHKAFNTWTDDERAADDVWNDYDEAVGTLFNQVTENYGWR
jgi:hypothetical protein